MESEELLDALGDKLAETIFWETVGDMEGKALLITMHHSRTEAKTETPSRCED